MNPEALWDQVVKGGLGIVFAFVLWDLGKTFLIGWQEAERYRHETETSQQQALQQLAAAATGASVSSRELTEEIKRLVSTYTGTAK